MNLIVGSPVWDRIQIREVTIRGGYEKSVLKLLRVLTSRIQLGSLPLLSASNRLTFFIFF
jgi:hypothetical protein